MLFFAELSVISLILQVTNINNCCLLSSASRPGEGRGSPGLLGPRSGHPLLQRVPEGVLPAPLHPPLSRMWPGRVQRLLSGATHRALPRLGPPSEGLQRLQPETWGALAGRRAGVGGGTVKDAGLYENWN